MNADIEPGARDTVGETRPLVFISHRHEDKALADVIGRFIRSSSAGQVEVYQSSEANAERPTAGNNLADELKRALWRAERVIFIYTDKDADWGWCLHECGLAVLPDTPPTRVTVFTCGASAPPQLAGRVVVKIRDRGDVQHFANQFLTSPDFFPGHNHAVTGFNENDADVVAAATGLFDALAEIPDPQGNEMRHWPANPFLQLEIEGEDHQRLQADGSHRQRLEIAHQILVQSRITDSDSEGARIFGRRWEPAADTRFGEFISGYRERLGDGQVGWLDALCDQMLAGARWEWPTLDWVLMRSMDRNDPRVYGPALTRVRRWPDNRMQFDVEFLPFVLDEGADHVKVRLPPPPQGDPD